MSDLPTGTVTFLFTDIEGSTTRWEQHPEAMRVALARHDVLLRSVMTSHGGFVFKMVGDAVYAVFAVAADAVAAALAAQRAVAAEEWGEVSPLRVRMALHTGAAQQRDEDYFGPTLNRVARVLSTGYGGQILLSTVSYELVRDSLAAGVTVRDLGEHTLKDLLRLEHVYQLTSPDLPGDFPPLKSLSRHPNNLPVQPTPFLGRQQEVASVCELVRRPELRLLTLTGPGGIGKTRIALQVAAELADQFADGVFFVALAPVRDPEQVLPAIIQALALTDTGQHDPLVLLKTALRDKRLLLVLDNFEQVIDAALLVADLLTACSGLKVLVTSRVVLHLQGEHELVVPPLSIPNPKRLPDLAALSQYEAVALFIERAQAVKADFQVTNANAPAVAAICAQLDGLPLAIELAAARVKYFPPQALLTRLEHGLTVLSGGARDLPTRQQTLRGAIAWSYDLLELEEQQLFRRFAVFVDGCTWEAAEMVCTAAGQLQGDILEGLVSLVDKSLLRQEEQTAGEARFWMLHVLREYGLEVLASAEETETTSQAHGQYYLRLAEEAEPQLRRAEQERWLARLEQEHENLRGALNWLLERARMEEGQEQAGQALRMCGALCWFWNLHGYIREGRTFLEQALAAGSGVGASIRAKALSGAAELAFVQDDYERVERLCGESLALSRELGDPAGVAASLFLLGAVAEARGQYAAARSLLEEAASLFQQVGDDWQRSRCLTQVARIALMQGEYGRARVLLEENLSLYRALGDKAGIGWLRCLQARLLFVSQQDLSRAQSLAEQSLALSRELGDAWHSALPLGLLGEIYLVEGEWTLARERLEESVALSQEAGDQRGAAEALMSLARVALAQDDLAAALHGYQECLALLQKIDHLGFLPACLEGLGAVVARQEVPLSAAELWGAAEALREAIGAPMHPVYRADYEQAVTAAHTQLGEQAFAKAWAKGRATPLEQVITDVLKKDGGAGVQ